MIEEADVSRLMRAEVESAEEPSTRLNIDQAMTAGRRQRRYRQGAGIGLAVVALVVGVATVPGLVSAGGSAPATGQGLLAPGDRPLEPFSGQVPPADPSRIPAALETVDPTILYARFGWLPTGLGSVQYQAGLLQSGSGVFLGAHLAGQPPQDWQGVSVRLYPKGVAPAAPQRSSGDLATVAETVSAPEVRGGPASFVRYSGAPTDEVLLRWEYAPGGWAEVRVSSWSSGLDVQDVALRVAQALRLSVTEPVPLPIPVDRAVPKALRPVTVNLSEPLVSSEGWYAGIDYADPAAGEDAARRGEIVSIGLFPDRLVREEERDDPGVKVPPAPNSTIDGHQAYFAPGGDAVPESLTVYDVAGVTIVIDARHGMLDAQGTKGLFQKLELTGVTADWRPRLTG
ncbi:hypothetical protein ACFP2T_20645 [Plantactinospora solaniradicis]|uniref:Uncharacterized protein n=1 Tax=Plantactinospora solaniradicis TaxID=1723736 RepID=A0ABW1K9T7_9ACTN